MIETVKLEEDMDANNQDDEDLDEEERKEAALGRELVEALSGPAGPSPLTWADWGLEPEQGTRFYAAAAAYYRAALWNNVASYSSRRFRLTVPGGLPWNFSLSGPTQPSILLFGMGPMDERETLQSTVLVLTYGPADDLSPRVRYEVTTVSGWEVAAPAAFPTLEFSDKVNLAVRQREAEDVIALLEALPRFVAANASQLREKEGGEQALKNPIRWTDPVTGAVIEDPPVREWKLRPVFTLPDRLEPSGPEGPGARPGDRLSPKKEDHFEYVATLPLQFERYLQRGGGGVSRPPGKTALRKHVTRASPFIAYLVGRQIPVEAVTELDLREFLYWRYPFDPIPGETDADAMLGSLRRFFAFLDDRKGVRCPWAKAILTDSAAFAMRIEQRPEEERSDGGVWLKELLDDLYGRALAPDSRKGSGIEWGAGKTQWLLFADLRRTWTLWRDEVIRGGTTDPAAVLDALAARERAWAETPNPVAGGATPAQAIAREQKDHS